MDRTSARWWQRLPAIVGTIAVVVLATTTAIVLFPSVRTTLGISFGPEPPAEGDVLAVPLPGTSASSVSVVILGRSTCAQCRAAVPFLADLVRELSRDSVPVFFVSSEQSIEEEREFASRIGVDHERVVLAESHSLVGVSFPTVAVVNGQRVIQKYWGPELIAARPPEMVDVLRQLKRGSER